MLNGVFCVMCSKRKKKILELTLLHTLFDDLRFSSLESTVPALNLSQGGVFVF